MYNKTDICKAAKRQEVAKAMKGEAAPMRGADGIKTMQVDPVLFHNARIQNQRDYGVQNIWDEPEFCDDMKRRHPEIAVNTIPRRTTIGGCGRGSGGVGRLIRRLGRVTFHKVY